MAAFLHFLVLSFNTSTQSALHVLALPVKYKKCRYAEWEMHAIGVSSTVLWLTAYAFTFLEFFVTPCLASFRYQMRLITCHCFAHLTFALKFPETGCYDVLELLMK